MVQVESQLLTPCCDLLHNLGLVPPSQSTICTSGLLDVSGRVMIDEWMSE